MRVLCLALVLLFSCLLAMADDAQTELTGAGSYFKPDNGSSSWSLNGEIAFPLSNGGHLLAGPAFQIVNGVEDFQAFGAVMAWNFFGKESGFFIEGAGLYDPDAPEGAKSHTLDARAGGKIRVGKSKSGLIKGYAERTIDGYGESADLRGVIAFGVAFGN